jgi:hypothetical protein
VNPWIAVVVIVVGVVAQVVFTVLKVPEAGIPMGIVSTGVAILLGARAHQDRRELNTLRRSLRPPPDAPDPSSVPPRLPP